MMTFREAARSKDFVISSELFLHPESTAEAIGEQVQLLSECVDGILVTDNQDGRLHLDPLAAAAIIKAHGGDPILQLACRNRNRIALLGELLGAAALGISSLMLIRGNRVPRGFQPRPKAVYDIDAVELIEMASNIKTDEHLPSFPDFFVGGLVSPHVPAPGWKLDKLTRKADAGAQFVMTHICMDLTVLRAYMKHLVAAGMPRRLSVFASIAIPTSAADARFLQQHHPSNLIPDDFVLRLDKAADSEQAAISICAEFLRDLADIPGISGAHLVPTQNLAAVNAVIEEAGFAP